SVGLGSENKSARALIRGCSPVACQVCFDEVQCLRVSPGRVAGTYKQRQLTACPRYLLYRRDAPDVDDTAEMRLRFRSLIGTQIETSQGLLSAHVVRLCFQEAQRSEERRVGKECRSRWWRDP